MTRSLQNLEQSIQSNSITRQLNPTPAGAATNLIHQATVISATNAGQSAPLGATAGREGVNFSLYSRDATCVELLLFDRKDDARPARVITLDSCFNRTYHYWHVFVPGLAAGQIY